MDVLVVIVCFIFVSQDDEKYCPSMHKEVYYKGKLIAGYPRLSRFIYSFNGSGPGEQITHPCEFFYIPLPPPTTIPTPTRTPTTGKRRAIRSPTATRYRVTYIIYTVHLVAFTSTFPVTPPTPHRSPYPDVYIYI